MADQYKVVYGPSNGAIFNDLGQPQLVWLGTRQQLDKLSATELSLLSARLQFSTTLSDLNVLIDGQLSMADHVSSLCRSCFPVETAPTGPVVTDSRCG